MSNRSIKRKGFRRSDFKQIIRAMLDDSGLEGDLRRTTKAWLSFTVSAEVRQRLEAQVAENPSDSCAQDALIAAMAGSIARLSYVWAGKPDWDVFMCAMESVIETVRNHHKTGADISSGTLTLRAYGAINAFALNNLAVRFKMKKRGFSKLMFRIIRRGARSGPGVEDVDLFGLLDMGFEEFTAYSIATLGRDGGCPLSQVDRSYDGGIGAVERRIDSVRHAGIFMHEIKKFDSRLPAIISMRVGLGTDEPMSLHEIGQSFGISAERIRQLIRSADSVIYNQNVG